MLCDHECRGDREREITLQPSATRKEAILTIEGLLLIVAGPGSGKTFMLVERIVLLITKKGVAPELLLVVTFTHKAVREPTLSDKERAKSFHLDTYCFDSRSEYQLFWDLVREERVKRIYFTGLLTHGQSDFFIQYIDPDTRAVRSYYPDFIFQRQEEDGSLKYVIVELKADHQIEDAVVQAKKEFAHQMAVASGMEYRILK